MKTLITKLYLIGFMVLTVYFTVMIWNLTFEHLLEDYRKKKGALEILKVEEAEANIELSFQKAILDSEKRIKHYLGYRVLEQRRLEGHFHHIDFEFKSDKTNYCIDCHGDLPHDKAKDIRAFTNMHASFISCQTCHVKLENSGKSGVFKWYDRTTGEIVESPVRKNIQPGTYTSKIIPFERVNGDIRRVDTPERKNFAQQYQENERELTDVQKAKAKKIIHQIVSTKPYRCEECHQMESPVLPFEDLGYSRKRIAAFAGTEVVGMIRDYDKFYMPRILHPGFGNEAQGNESPNADKTKQ